MYNENNFPYADIQNILEQYYESKQAISIFQASLTGCLFYYAGTINEGHGYQRNTGGYDVGAIPNACFIMLQQLSGRVLAR